MKILLNADLKHYVKCDYKTSYDCDNYGCDDICRCQKISNPVVSIVDFITMSEYIYKEIYRYGESTKRDEKLRTILFDTDKNFDIYCIDRILRCHKIFKQEFYDIEIIQGYYGDETDSIKLKKSISSLIDKDITELLSLNKLKEKVEFILTKEYGFILPELKDKQYDINYINSDDLLFGQEKHNEKVINGLYEYYSDKSYNNIRGVVIESDSKYRVIDGYHRLNNTKNKQVKVIIAK
jgi:hypothetical protein